MLTLVQKIKKKNTEATILVDRNELVSLLVFGAKFHHLILSTGCLLSFEYPIFLVSQMV